MGDRPAGGDIGQTLLDAEDEGEMVYKVLDRGLVRQLVEGMNKLALGRLLLLGRHCSPPRLIIRREALARLGDADFGEGFSRLHIRERDAVAVEDGAGVDGGDPRAGGDVAGEVEGVDGADADELALLLHAADFAEGFHGLWARVLLAVEAGHEAAASDGTSRLHATERAEDVAPGDGDVLALDEVAEDDAVAEEELFGPGFGEVFCH